MDMRLEHLRSNSISHQLRGLLESVAYKSVTETEVAAIVKLTESISIIGGHRICDYAAAALDILSVKKYTGADESVQELIHSMPDFVFD